MRILEGIIISIGKNNSAIVEVTRRVPHPMYKKLIKRSKKFTVDTGEFELGVGNGVRITETRPMSKTKYFKVSEIISKKEVKKTKAVSVGLTEEVESSTEDKSKVEKKIKVKKEVKVAKKGKAK